MGGFGDCLYRQREREKNEVFFKMDFQHDREGRGGCSRYVCYGFLLVFMIFVLHLLFLLLVYNLFVWLRITMVATSSIVDHRFECMFYFCGYPLLFSSHFPLNAKCYLPLWCLKIVL